MINVKKTFGYSLLGSALPAPAMNYCILTNGGSLWRIQLKLLQRATTKATAPSPKCDSVGNRLTDKQMDTVIAL